MLGQHPGDINHSRLFSQPIPSRFPESSTFRFIYLSLLCPFLSLSLTNPIQQETHRPFGSDVRGSFDDLGSKSVGRRKDVSSKDW